jgi:putative ABC transport system permease protein
MIFRSLVAGNVRENGLRSFVTVAAVALGVSIGLAIDLADGTAVRSFASSVNIIANRVNLQVLGIGRPFDERTLLRVERIDGVADASPVIEGSIAVGARAGDPFAGDVLRVQGLDITRPLPKARDQEVDVPGAFGASGGQGDLAALVAGDGAIISRRLATRYHLRAGSEVRALAGDRPVRLTIAGMLPETSGIDSSTVFVDIATAQDVLQKAGKLDRIDIVADPARLTQVEAAVARALPPGARVIEPKVRTSEIRRMLRSFTLNLAALSYVALLVGMYLIYNTVAISVVQRKPEIGTLRALGATRGEIFRAFLGEGLLFGVAGSAAGVAAGCLLAQVSVQAVSRTVDTLYVGTHADRVIYDPLLLLKAFLLGIVFAVMSAVAPALDAARTPPALAMRSHGVGLGVAGARGWWDAAGAGLLVLAYVLSRFPAVDAIPVFGYASALCVIAGVSLLSPRAVGVIASASAALAGRIGGAPGIWLKLAAANVRSSLRRNGVAVAALMVAIGMVTSVSILISSFRTTVVAWSDEALRADLFVRPLGLQDAGNDARFSPGVAARVRAVRGVDAVDTFRAISVPYNGSITTVGATDFGAFEARSKIRMLSGLSVPELSAALPNADRLIASDPFAVRYGVKTGDRVTLETAEGPRRFTVVSIYNDYSSDAGVLLMDTTTFKRVYHDDSINSLAVYAKPGVDLSDLRSRIERAVEPLRIDVQTNRELRAFVVAIFNRTFAITYALDVIAIVVAALGVVSTLFALVLERRREIAILRYLGLATGGVRGMVFGEAACIGLTGGLLGVFTGILLGLLLVYVINRQAFGWLIELRVPWGLLASTVALVVATAIAAGLYPAAVAARIRTSDALRAE